MNTESRVRLFRRDDRDQLTDLVNAHLSAAIPGARVSVNTVLSSLERQPDEYVVDPWVVERATIVVEQNARLVAAAHLHRFGEHLSVSEDYRGAGLVQWFLSLPEGEVGERAADALMGGCLAQLRAWSVTTAFADGQLPFPGVYGVPSSWPHVRRALERGGFAHDGSIETVLMASTSELAHVSECERTSDVVMHRELGADGTRFIATRDAEAVGYIEVDVTANRAERHSAGIRLAELSDWEASNAEVFARLITEVRDWLTRSDVRRVIAAIDPVDAEDRALLAGAGFREVSSNARAWSRPLR